MKRLTIKTDRGDFSVCFWKGPANAPILHWAHANGFNGQTYNRLLRKLTRDFNVYAWDAPGYGMTEKGAFYNTVSKLSHLSLFFRACFVSFNVLES